MKDWRNDMLLEIKEVARKKVARRNFVTNDLLAILVGIIASSVIVVPAYFKETPVWVCGILTFAICIFCYFIFHLFDFDIERWEIETEVEKQAQKIFPEIAKKTEMHALSSVFIYKDLKDTYDKEQKENEQISLQEVQETIQKRNQEVLTKARQSIIYGRTGHILCSVCKDSIQVKNDTILKVCSCKGVQMYQNENRKELF